jgi:predicted RNase H-like nuclease (RuvC/YqgF family)
MPRIAVNLSPEQVEALSKLFPDLPVEDALLAVVSNAIASPTEKASRPEERSLKSVIDAINAYTGKIDEMNRRLSHIIELLEDLAARVQNLEDEVSNALRSPRQARPEERKEPRRSAIDILKDQKVMFESDIASKIRNRDAFFDKLRRSGAVVLELAKERVAVDPGFFAEFKRKVENLSVSSDEALQKELGKVEVKLLKVMMNSGVAYFDGVKKKWVIDVDEQST